MTSPGYVIAAVDEESCTKDPFEREEQSPAVRWCDICENIKENDVHHCSVCKRCILKMDHHCPWIANCVGLYNKKYFLLFLFYTSITCIYMSLVSTSTILYSSSFSQSINLITLTTWILSIGIGLILLGFFIFHLILVCRGITTLDYVAGRSLPLHCTILKNLDSDLGKNRWLWLIPTSPNLSSIESSSNQHKEDLALIK